MRLSDMDVHCLALALLAAVVHLSHGQIPLPGYCPRTPANKDFDIYRYLGRWYEHRRVYVGYQELGRCWRGTYSKSRKGGIQVDIDSILYGLNIPTRVTIDLKRNLYAPNKFRYTTRLAPLPFPPLSAKYEVLATDYDNWTIEYDCNNTKNGKEVYVGILTRKQFPSKYEVAGAFEFLKKHHVIPLSSLMPSPQENCRPKKKIFGYG